MEKKTTRGAAGAVPLVVPRTANERAPLATLALSLTFVVDWPQ